MELINIPKKPKKWFGYIYGFTTYAGVIGVSYAIWKALDYIPVLEQWVHKDLMLLFILSGYLLLILRCEKLSDEYRRQS